MSVGRDADREAIAAVVTDLFAAFTSGPSGTQRLTALRDSFIPQAVIVQALGVDAAVYDVDGFIAPRQALLAGDAMTEFREWEVAGTTEVLGDIAQHSCSYAKSWSQGGEPRTGRGRKTLQLVRTSDGWKISALAWDDER